MHIYCTPIFHFCFNNTGKHLNTKKQKYMSYFELNIIRPLYGQRKKISASTLKFGDRFFLEEDKSLWFKLDVEPTNNQYLCSNDRGDTKLLDGNIKVTRINGIRDSLYSQAKQIVEKYLEN